MTVRILLADDHAVVRQLAEHRPDLRVLILSMHDNEQLFFEALRAGAGSSTPERAARISADHVTSGSAAAGHSRDRAARRA